MEIEESNKLIAGFDNLKSGIYPSTDGKGYWTTKIGDISKCHGELLLYHKSWDWLIPVINKIFEQVGEYHEEYNKIMSPYWQQDIKETHKRVVKFIKWYNER